MMGFSVPENGSRKLLAPTYVFGEVPISVPGSYFGGPHTDLTMFVFVDGHVQSVATSAAIEVLTALATRDGGEAIDINGL